MSRDPKYILLVEDDMVVAELVKHAFAMHEPAPPVVHVRDGVDALDFLYEREQFEGRDTGPPCVVLLDLKMPRLDGLEVLRQVKSDPHLKATPIVMLTSSQDDRDLRDSYLLGANGYIVKPVEFRHFAAVLQSIDDFWVQLNQPAPRRHVTEPARSHHD